MKEKIDNNVDAMIRVEEGGRDGLNSHVQTRPIVDETQARGPVVGVERVVGYGSEQEPNAEHDDGEVVGLLRFGDATTRQRGQIGRVGQSRAGRHDRAVHGRGRVGETACTLARST